MKRFVWVLLTAFLSAAPGCTGPRSARGAHEWKSLRATDDASLVPGSGTIRFPSRTSARP